MTFKQKNIVVTLVIFSLILVFYIGRVSDLVSNGNFAAPNVFWLWGTVLVMAVVGSIVGMILTHVGSAIWIAASTGDRDPEIDESKDERDALIDLKGTRTEYVVFSLGTFLAMLAFVVGQPALVMFALLVFVSIVAQVAGDAWRLWLYERGV